MNEDQFEEVKCPICNQLNLRKISTKGQFGIPANVSICKNDGLVFLNPRWNKERYHYFYENEYDKYYRSKIFNGEDEEKKYVKAKRMMSRVAQDIKLNINSKVLEVGSGMGWTLSYLSRKYCIKDLSAIESSKFCKENLRNMGVNVISDDVESDWYKSSQKYDFIYLRHAFEHFLDPFKVLSIFSESLREDGYVYIVVPNMMRPSGSLTRYYYRVVHTFYYSLTSFTNLVNRSDLEIVKIEESNLELWALLRKRKGGKELKYINCYQEQYNLINKYRLKSAYHNLAYLIIGFLRKYLPTALKNSLKKVLSR